MIYDCPRRRPPDDPRASIREVHSRIDCPGGEVEMEILFDPRFDYARDAVEREASKNPHVEVEVKPLSDEAIQNLLAAEPYCIRPTRSIRRVPELLPGVSMQNHVLSLKKSSTPLDNP